MNNVTDSTYAYSFAIKTNSKNKFVENYSLIQRNKNERLSLPEWGQ